MKIVIIANEFILEFIKRKLFFATLILLFPFYTYGSINTAKFAKTNLKFGWTLASYNSCLLLYINVTYVAFPGLYLMPMLF